MYVAGHKQWNNERNKKQNQFPTWKSSKKRGKLTVSVVVVNDGEGDGSLLLFVATYTTGYVSCVRIVLMTRFFSGVGLVGRGEKKKVLAAL